MSERVGSPGRQSEPAVLPELQIRSVRVKGPAREKLSNGLTSRNAEWQ